MAEPTESVATEEAPKQEAKKKVARTARPAKPAPNVRGMVASQGGSETSNAPGWSIGISNVLTAVISILLVLGFESIGGGIADLISSRADKTRIESLTTAQIMQGMQAANTTLQQRVLQLENDMEALEQENRELRTILKYQNGIVVTAVSTSIPILPTPLATVEIALPTETPDALHEFEQLMTPEPTVPIVVTVGPTATVSAESAGTNEYGN